MINEEIRKLLGGYATNTLTESERKTLFDAALEDQELFNALQEDQALRDLLADPVARAQVRQALDQHASSKQRAAWRTRWWAWGGAASAVATAALLFVVFRANNVPSSRPIQIASTETTTAENAPARQAKEPEAGTRPALDDRLAAPLKKEATAAGSPTSVGGATAAGGPTSVGATAALGGPAAVGGTAAAVGGTTAVGGTAVGSAAGVGGAGAATRGVAAPPPPPASPARLVTGALQPPAAELAQRKDAATEQAQQRVQGQSPAGLNSFRDTLGTLGAQQQAGALASNIGPPLRYVLVKRDANGADSPVTSAADLKTGDSVRLSVYSGTAGNLALDQRDAAGGWKRLSASTISANSTSTIPESPILVQSGAARFRLTLEPLAVQSENLGRAKAAKRVMESDAALKPSPAVPLIREFTIGPGQIP